MKTSLRNKEGQLGITGHTMGSSDLSQNKNICVLSKSQQVERIGLIRNKTEYPSSQNKNYLTAAKQIGNLSTKSERIDKNNIKFPKDLNRRGCNLRSPTTNKKIVGGIEKKSGELLRIIRDIQNSNSRQSNLEDDEMHKFKTEGASKEWKECKECKEWPKCSKCMTPYMLHSTITNLKEPTSCLGELRKNLMNKMYGKEQTDNSSILKGLGAKHEGKNSLASHNSVLINKRAATSSNKSRSNVNLQQEYELPDHTEHTEQSAQGKIASSILDVQALQLSTTQSSIYLGRNIRENNSHHSNRFHSHNYSPFLERTSKGRGKTAYDNRFMHSYLKPSMSINKDNSASHSNLYSSLGGYRHPGKKLNLLHYQGLSSKSNLMYVNGRAVRKTTRKLPTNFEDLSEVSGSMYPLHSFPTTKCFVLDYNKQTMGAPKNKRRSPVDLVDNLLKKSEKEGSRTTFNSALLVEDFYERMDSMYPRHLDQTPTIKETFKTKYRFKKQLADCLGSIKNVGTLPLPSELRKIYKTKWPSKC